MTTHRIVNLNGTSKKELIRQQSEIARRARDLLEALKEAAPHGRDYQGWQDPKMAYSIDRMAHEADMKAVQAIIDKATEDGCHIACQ